MVQEKLRGLSAIQAACVRRVELEVGEIAASSLERVLRQGPNAKRFQGIDLIQLRKICLITDEEGIELSTKEI